MGKQKIDISVFDEAVKKVDVSAFDGAVKKKEPSASSAEPSRTQPTQQEQPSTSLTEDLGIGEEELVPTRQEAQQLQQPILDTSDRLREGGQAPDLGSAIETDIRVNEDILRSVREGRPAEQESEFQFDEQVSISSDSEKPVQVEAEIEEPKLKPNETTGVARSLAPAKQILPPFAQTSAAINFYDERVERDYVEAITSNKGKIKAIEKDLEAIGQPTQENASAYLELFNEYNKSATEQVLLLKEKLQFDYDKLIQKDFDERGGVRLAMETLPIGARFGFKAVGSLTAKAQKIAASGASWLAASKFLTTYEQDPNEPLLYREQATEMKQNFLAWARGMYESSIKTSKEYGLVNTIEETNDPLALADFAVTAISETMVDIPLTLITFGGSSYIQTYGNMFLEGLQTLSKEQGKPIEEIINTEDVDRAALNTASLIVTGLDRIGAGKVLGGTNLPFMKDALKKNALKQSAIKRAVGGTLVEVGTENIQEPIEAGGEFASLGKDFIEGMARLDVDDYLNITAKTLFGAGAMSTVNAYMDNGKLTNEFLDVLSKATESELTYKALTSTILARQSAGIYTKEQAESRLQDLMSDIEANQSLPRSIKGDARVEAIGLQKEYSEVKEARDQASDAFKSMYNEELNNLEERLTNILRDETSKKDQELLEAEIRQENEQEKLREEEQTRNVVGDEKTVLEELSDDRIQEEVGQESPELRTETQEVDAVQEQQAEGVDVREQAEVSEEVVEEVRGEEIVAGDKVTVTYEDYVRGKKTKKQRRGVIDSVNPDGSFNIRAKEGVYKNISPEGVSKVKSTPTVESETQGLTEKERFVQGFKEIMSAKDEKIRQAKESVKEKLSQARAKFGERMSAQRKKTGEAKTARAELGRLINLEMKELGLSDVRASRVKSMLSSMKNITPNNIDSVIERAYGLVVAEAKAQRLNTYKKKSKEAKRRIQRGDFDTVSVGMIPLMELDVRAILDEDIKRYTELVDDFSRRGKFAVEDVAAKIQEANEIVNRAAEQLGLREVEASNIAQGLTEENYNKAISELAASGDITQDMADFMRANKKRLLELEKKPVNKEQVFFEIQDKIEFVKNNQQDLSDRPVKQKAQDVISSVKREDLENMSDADLSLLNRVLDAMEVGLMPSQASKLEQTIEAQRTANSMNEQTKQEKSIVGKVFDAIDTPIRELASGKAKRVRRQMIKSQSTTPDSSFGFKGKAISKALEPFNIAYGELEAQANKYKGMLARAIKNIKKSQASDIRGFLYMAEMHRNANPQSNKAYTVKQLIDVLTGTTEARETYISNYGEKRYKEILKTYDKFKDEKGELDAKKLYESMSKAERDYVSTAEIIFSENTEFARDARWVRGESFEELNYYMHYPVVMQASKSDVNASVDNMMNSGIVRPSTKAGNLEERTEGVKLVSFSLAESVQNSYQQTLEDYYLTQPLRTERKAFNMFEKMNSNNDEMFSFASGVNKGAEDFRRYLLVSKQVSNFNNPITNAIKAGAYRYMLGSTARAVKEVLSNQSYVAMSDLVNFETASFKSFEIAKKTLTEPDWLFKAVANLPISDKQRILGNAVFAGQADAATMLGEDVGFTARAQSLETRIGKGIEAMQDLGITVNIKGNRIRISNKAYMEALLKTPDMFYSRGVFFDKLQRAYKKETGESLDLDKLTDKKFINDNRVLFDKITKEASAAVRKAFSTTNLAERSGVQLKASAEGGMFNAVKYFMLPFVINEYEQLRMAAVEDGLFGGLKTAIPILSRFAVYGALTGALTRAIAAALSDEDEPIEDILPSKDEFMKSLISSVVTLTLQRNWTFAPRAASNYVIEYLNKEFGEGITRESKEYDKFKDNIMFNRMNLDDVMGMRWTEMAQIIAPQYSPLLSSYEAAMKSTDERNKQRKEYLEWKALVTALTGIGFLPRDVRDIYIYSNDDVRDLIFDDKKKGVSGTIKGGSSSGALSGGRGTTIKGAAR